MDSALGTTAVASDRVRVLTCRPCALIELCTNGDGVQYTLKYFKGDV